MKTLLRDGHRTVELCRWQDCSASDAVMNLGGLDFALLFLQKFKVDPSSMALLRRFTAYQSDFMSLSKMNDHQVLQLLAHKISNQQIKIVLHKTRSSFKGGSGQAVLAPPTPQPRPSVARPAPLEPVEPITAPPPIEEAVFAAVDPAAQAATLKSAAQSGAPFCEECAKARSA